MKIGAAIIACDRLEFTLDCAYHLHTNRRDLSEVIIVNDGTAMAKGMTYDIEWLDNKPPYQSVGATKDRALKELLQRGCTDIFLIENDILVQTPDVFKKYIDASHGSGIEHLNFGYHGPANRTPDYKHPNPRAVIDYPDGTKIALNPHSVGAFSYYSKRFIETVGFHDPHFKNAWEHVELCQRAITKGLLPAFWWFPDVAGSDDWLKEIPGSIQKSSITHTPEWVNNMKKGAEYYMSLHGTTPVGTKDTDLERVQSRLKTIYRSYHKR
jgi:GT2 family glycosyltransferase